MIYQSEQILGRPDPKDSHDMSSPRGPGRSPGAGRPGLTDSPAAQQQPLAQTEGRLGGSWRGRAAAPLPPSGAAGRGRLAEPRCLHTSVNSCSSLDRAEWFVRAWASGQRASSPARWVESVRRTGTRRAGRHPASARIHGHTAEAAIRDEPTGRTNKHHVRIGSAQKKRQPVGWRGGTQLARGV